jgi:long-subunit fatty acid transport protein
MGFKLNLNRLNQNESFYPFYDFSESVYKESWAIGTTYNINFSENKSIRFGLAFESEILFNKAIDINIESPDTTGIIGVNRPPNFYMISRNFNMTGKVPGKLLFDIDITLSQKLKVLGNITTIFWSGISDDLKNQLEFSGSVIYSFNNTISSSIGAYYTNRKLKDDKDDFFGYQNKLYALFLTAGLNVKYGFLDVGLAVADSHLASSNLRKQTILKMIVVVNIN